MGKIIGTQTINVINRCRRIIINTRTFNTVTTEQLAQRVKALIDDLISHGLIGT